MTLKIQILMLIVAALAFSIGFMLGHARAERKYRGSVRRIKTPKNFKNEDPKASTLEAK